jgi:hypothetical protein
MNDSYVPRLVLIFLNSRQELIGGGGAILEGGESGLVVAAQIDILEGGESGQVVVAT